MLIINITTLKEAFPFLAKLTGHLLSNPSVLRIDPIGFEIALTSADVLMDIFKKRVF
jgi:hypothetical protein